MTHPHHIWNGLHLLVAGSEVQHFSHNASAAHAVNGGLSAPAMLQWDQQLLLVQHNVSALGRIWNDAQKKLAVKNMKNLL